MDVPRGPDPANAPTVPNPASAQAGDTVGRYRLLRRVGEGGMGEVWLAEQTTPIRRQVAFKVIKLGMDSAQVIARFEAERQALALMDHPAIATVFDGGTTPEGRPFFAMEYVKGEPITTYCDRHKLSMAERLDLFLQVCDGVQHAHRKGIIHRDLKPSNVLVTIHDDHPVPKVIDFGVAKATAQQLIGRTLFTELGVMIGTPEYMSPEQAEMTGLDVDTRTDVYALGVMLYELLTGALPFDRKALREAGLDGIRRMIREKEPSKPSTRVTQLGPASAKAARDRHLEPSRFASRLRGDLDWITMKALDKDRTRRYGSASDFAADVRRHVDHQPVLARSPSTGYRARKFVRRHRFGAGATATLLALLVVFGITLVVQAQRVARERDRANREAQAATQVADFLTGLFRVSDPAETRGREVTAREVLDKGAARIGAELTHDPVLQARLLFTMGDVYRQLGALDPAEQLLTQSLDTRSRILGAEAPDTLRTMSLLGLVYDLDGKTEEAEKLLASALAAEQRTLGEDHPNTLKTLANLANLYDSQGHYEKSVPMMQDVFERRRDALGAEHLDTLGSQYNLAVAMYRGERFADAERLLGEVAASFARVSGADHPYALMAKDLLATVYLAQKRPDDAQRILEEVYDARRRVLGPEHMDTLGTRLGMADVARLQGRFAEAELLFRDTLAAQERIVGPDHPDTVATRVSLATMLSAAGRLDEAERLWRETLSWMQRTLVADHPDLAKCFVGLAAIEMNRGRRDAALDLLAQAVHVDPRWGPKLAAEPDEFAALKGNPAFDRLVAAGDNRK